MTAVEHLIAWIESSRPHYERLLQLEIERKAGGFRSNDSLAFVAYSIASSAYREAVRGGDMFPEQHSPATILEAARALLDWELES